MLLQNKIVKEVRDIFNRECSIIDNGLSFTYLGITYNIIQKNIFKYIVSSNNLYLFIGNYFELIGFLGGLQVDRSDEIKVSDPTPVLVKIGNMVNSSIPSDTEEKYKKEIQGLKDANIQLNASKTAAVTKNSNYKKEIQKLNKSIQQKIKEFDEAENKHKQELDKKDLEINKLKEDCEEAALLISDLYYKASNITVGRKTYKLENFPEDVQKFIKEIIDEYYNK